MALGPADADAQPRKQLLDLAGRPMLVRILDAIDASRAAACVAVVNAHIASRIETLRPGRARLHYAVNPRPESEMIESIQIGLQAARTLAQASDRPPSSPALDGFLVCPADHPCITPQIIDRCIDAFDQNPSRIVIAAHRGRRGHPIILPADLAFDVLSWPAARGLNELRRLHPERVSLVDIGDEGVLIDVDTPADLQRARDRISR